jgi:2-polyprenyl-6-methoxyphenol hydroxylase-like FAD-dependent oxidoreductase
MTSTDLRYDVIVVGGRPAGASLAARLGARGLSVLVVDKAEFPSHPEVPSCPLMYASAIQLFDEIGLREADYAAATTRIHKGIVGFEGYFQVTLDVPMAHGRDYLYGFDRGRFDHALWNHLGGLPSVERRSGFAVSDLLRNEDGRVVGICGATKGGAPERLGARLAVVGADGRHSLIARKVGARVVEEQAACTSTIHFAEWAGLGPATPDGEPAIQIVSTGRGQNVLFFPSCDGRVSVATHVRTDRANIGGNASEYYLGQLRSLATVRRRLEGAQQVGPVLGVRRIANRYREHGGPGWVLVGDAVHHKDPIDGQGIYDALIEARHLAELLVALHEQRLSWDALLDRYHHAVIGETHKMFQATMERLARDLYSDPPPLMIRTLLRWALEDPAYQRRFLLFLTRTIPPERFRTPSLMAAVTARGVARDLLGLFRRTRPVRPREGY